MHILERRPLTAETKESAMAVFPVLDSTTVAAGFLLFGFLRLRDHPQGDAVF